MKMGKKIFFTEVPKKLWWDTVNNLFMDGLIENKISSSCKIMFIY